MKKLIALLLICCCPGLVSAQSWGNIPVAGYIPVAGSSACSTTSTLVAYWDMSAGSGTTQTNLSCLPANSLTITPGSGGWTTQTGLSKGAYNFDGVATTGTHMDAANKTYLNFDYNQPLSIVAWVNVTATSGYTVILSTLDASNSYRGYEFAIGYGGTYSVEFGMLNSSPSNHFDVFGGIVSTGVLQQVAVTYDGSHTAAGVKLYLNGSSVGTTVNADTLSATTTNAIVPRVGMRPNSTIPFKGKLGPVMIWNRVLNSTEISALNSSPYAVVN